MKDSKASLRLVAWEITRNCNLACIHCRASATHGPYENELSTKQAFTLLDQISEVAKPIIILTGGEPLLRDDILDVTQYGDNLGFRMVMALNGTLITPQLAKGLKKAGIQRMSISLDGATKSIHDSFRGVEGAFDNAMDGIKIIKEAGIEFQVNTTVTQLNFGEVQKIQALAQQLGAVAHHIFLLVPTGRGKYILNQSITAKEYEEILNWFYDQKENTNLELKATCAPHYYRILRQKAKAEGQAISFKTHGLDAVTRGCLGGVGFCFISHTGNVQPCGYLDLNCGDITNTPFQDVWYNSNIFCSLRDYSQLKGKCGMCEYKKVCGGCRARAHEQSGDYLAEEPLCAYTPRKTESNL